MSNELWVRYKNKNINTNFLWSSSDCVDDLSLSGFDNTLQRNGVFLNIDEIHSFEKNFKKIFSNNKIYNDLRKKSFGIWEKNSTRKKILGKLTV